MLPVRQCDDVFFSNRSRPCLQHQIKRCSAPCVDLISKEAYRKDIELAGYFLQGKDDSLTETLQDNMIKASKELRFEEAAGWRDRINALRRVQSHQSITSGHSDIDIITMASLHGKVCVEVTFIRGGRHSGSNGHFPKVPLDFSASEILSAFIAQYYHNRQAPKQIVTGFELDDAQELTNWLSDVSDRKVVMTHNVRGNRKDWLAIAQLNVTERLKRNMSEAQSVEKR